jgi:hypothetical protein
LDVEVEGGDEDEGEAVREERRGSAWLWRAFQDGHFCFTGYGSLTCSFQNWPHLETNVKILGDERGT